MRYVIALSLLAAPALAETCPPAPDHSKDLSVLFERVQDAPTEMDARPIANEMWALWVEAPNEQAQAILDKGMRQREVFDYAGALSSFDMLVEYCPAYAEGYNQRAFVHFLRQDFGAALPDLEKALDLSPGHVGALSGKALTLMGLGRGGEAALTLRAALELNPWLPERGLLPTLEAMEEDL